MNHLRKRALSLTYDDSELTTEELLEKDGSFTIHHCNIQTLCIELYKVYHNLSQTIFSNLFLPQFLQFTLKTRFCKVSQSGKLNQVFWSNNLELSA